MSEAEQKTKPAAKVKVSTKVDPAAKVKVSTKVDPASKAKVSTEVDPASKAKVSTKVELAANPGSSKVLLEAEREVKVLSKAERETPIFPPSRESLSAEQEKLDLINLPNVRCVSCGNPRIAGLFRVYTRLLAAGTSPEISSRYLFFKHSLRLCCLNSIKSPAIYDEASFKDTSHKPPEGIKRIPVLMSTSTLGPAKPFISFSSLGEKYKDKETKDKNKPETPALSSLSSRASPKSQYVLTKPTVKPSLKASSAKEEDEPILEPRSFPKAKK